MAHIEQVAVREPGMTEPRSLRHCTLTFGTEAHLSMSARAALRERLFHEAESFKGDLAAHGAIFKIQVSHLNEFPLRL